MTKIAIFYLALYLSYLIEEAGKLIVFRLLPCRLIHLQKH